MKSVSTFSGVPAAIIGAIFVTIIAPAIIVGCAGDPRTLGTNTGSRSAQNGKEHLAILPFTGGARDEGDTIATLLSHDLNLAARFGIMPRTGIARAIAQEQRFQTTSGMTDADTIAALGEQLGAKYVMAGSITALGSQKVLVVSIIRIETMQPVAGDFLTYTTIEE
jgi:TolB-like protein